MNKSEDELLWHKPQKSDKMTKATAITVIIVLTLFVAILIYAGFDTYNYRTSN